MSRRKDETCLFCGTVPCSCNTPRVKSTPRSAPKATVRAAPRVAQTPTPTVDPEALKLAVAARTLAAMGMLHPTEHRRHAALIALGTDRTPNLDQRIQDWKIKVRHGSV